MSKQFLKDAVGWGFVLWLIGYILGIVLFPFVPNAIIGWIIMPIGVIITLLVLFKKIKGQDLKYYIYIGLVWMVIAIVFDYLFIIKALGAQGYYKPDVYFYYLLAFIMPIGFGWYKF